MKAIHLTAYGNPLHGLKLVDIAEPGEPGKGQVLIEIEFAPINLSDLMLAGGVYFLRPELPSVIGGEGAGRVLSVGTGVSNVKVGDRVTVPFGTFSWAQKVLAPADQVFVVPEQIGAATASMLSINPTTALLLLTEFVHLDPGSWVIFNAANSHVGRALLSIARMRGIKTACVVRRPELIAELTAAGADFVGVDSPALPAQLKNATGGASIRLALDAVGGPAAQTLASVLDVGGQLIVYAVLGGDPVMIDQGHLIGKKLTVRGFWMYHDEFLPKLAARMAEAADAIVAGALSLEAVATYPLAELGRAIAHVQRGGKILLDFRT
jgi:NADPH:quinone reductase-like Zn-dependent oxidoreductase